MRKAYGKILRFAWAHFPKEDIETFDAADRR
jgi:hypothetical protein